MLAVACSSSSSSTDPLASLSADQIAGKAIANVRSASSLHMAGQAPAGGKTATVDATLAKEGCDIKLTIPGEGAVELIADGSSAWMKASAQFWEATQGGAKGQIITEVLDGRYAKMSSSDATSLESSCSPQDLAKQFSSGNDTMVKGQTITINGQQALALRDTADNSVGYVSVSANPELLRIAKDQYKVDLTDYDAPVTISPPAADQVLDLSQFGQ
jgi:hypothetical protein